MLVLMKSVCEVCEVCVFGVRSKVSGQLAVQLLLFLFKNKVVITGADY